MNVRNIVKITLILIISLPTILVGCGVEEFDEGSLLSASQHTLSEATQLNLDDGSETGGLSTLAHGEESDVTLASSWLLLSRKSVIWQRSGRQKSKVSVAGRLIVGEQWTEFMLGYENRETDTWEVTVSDCNSGDCTMFTTVEIPVSCRRRGRDHRLKLSCSGRIRFDGGDASVLFRSQVGPQPALLKVTYNGAISHGFDEGDLNAQIAIKSLENECDETCSERLILPISGQRRGPRAPRFDVTAP
jgi:hypothetical protein